MFCGTSPSFMVGYWVSSYRRIALSYWVNRTVGLQDSEDLVTWIDISFCDFDVENAWAKHTSDNLNLSDTVGVTEDNTDLGWGCALLGKLADLGDNL